MGEACALPRAHNTTEEARGHVQAYRGSSHPAPGCCAPARRWRGAASRDGGCPGRAAPPRPAAGRPPAYPPPPHSPGAPPSHWAQASPQAPGGNSTFASLPSQATNECRVRHRPSRELRHKAAVDDCCISHKRAYCVTVPPRHGRAASRRRQRLAAHTCSVEGCGLGTAMTCSCGCPRSFILAASSPLAAAARARPCHAPNAASGNSGALLL